MAENKPEKDATSTSSTISEDRSKETKDTTKTDAGGKEKEKDRISEILEALESEGPFPEHLLAKNKTQTWDPDKLEEELKQHPFFMTEMPKEGEPIPPWVEAFQQLKYSPDENTPNELALNFKEDGLFHYKLKKYRIATKLFSEGLRSAESPENESPDDKLISQLYNNRAAAQFHLKNFRSALQDCDKALARNPDYVKPLMKALECCVKLEKWEKTLEYCTFADKVIPGNTEVQQIRIEARRKRRLAEALARKLVVDSRKEDLELTKLISSIKERGIKVTNEKFLSEEAALSGKRVVVDEDGRLHWPVLFYYPQYSLSDFIESFHEDSRFIDHLEEILDNDHPSWDRDNEYNSKSVEVYFIDTTSGGYVKVDKEESLATVMTHKRYNLPTNGVPGFFVMARDNEMCKVILERCE